MSTLTEVGPANLSPKDAFPNPAERIWYYGTVIRNAFAAAREAHQQFASMTDLSFIPGMEYSDEDIAYTQRLESMSRDMIHAEKTEELHERILEENLGSGVLQRTILEALDD